MGVIALFTFFVVFHQTQAGVLFKSHIADLLENASSNSLRDGGTIGVLHGSSGSSGLTAGWPDIYSTHFTDDLRESKYNRFEKSKFCSFPRCSN